MANKNKKPKRKLRKPLSLYPLSMEEAIRISMSADPKKVRERMKKEHLKYKETEDVD